VIDLLANAAVDIATLGVEIVDEEEKTNPNVVKIVGSPKLLDGRLSERHLRALYFTRATAPWGEGPLYHHIGLYAYRRAALERYVALLRRWQPAQNLVSPHTLGEIWRRHIADSAQLVALFPEARRWIDIGSGAGLPGMITAILLADTPGALVPCVESNQRKCAFLRAAIRETGAPAVVQEGRIESVLKQWRDPADFISARALASFPALLDLTEPLTSRGVACAFHKGEDFDAELAEASQSWALDLVRHKSLIDPTSSIIEVRRAERRPA